VIDRFAENAPINAPQTTGPATAAPAPTDNIAAAAAERKTVRIFMCGVLPSRK